MAAPDFKVAPTVLGHAIIPAGSAAAGKVLAKASSTDYDTAWVDGGRILRCVIDGGGIVITTGAKKAYLSVPLDCTVTKWRVLADVSGSAVVDVWKSTYSGFPPTVANTIAGTDLPTISSAQKAESTALTGWTTSLSAGDVLEFNVNSASTVTRLYVDIFVKAR